MAKAAMLPSGVSSSAITTTNDSSSWSASTPAEFLGSKSGNDHVVVSNAVRMRNSGTGPVPRSPRVRTATTTAMAPANGAAMTKSLAPLVGGTFQLQLAAYQELLYQLLDDHPLEYQLLEYHELLYHELLYHELLYHELDDQSGFNTSERTSVRLFAVVSAPMTTGDGGLHDRVGSG